MFKTEITMTAQTPSGFAMPTSVPTTAALCGTGLRGTGLGTGADTATVAARTAPVYVARERLVTGDAIAQPFPGPTAWSPPTS
jgi:hypothetical protein